VEDRLSELHVPLVGGIDQAVDTKLLPDGRLSALSDVRFRKQGKIGPRNGYAAGVAGVAAVASVEHAPGHNLMLTDRTGLGNGLAPQVHVTLDSTGGIGEFATGAVANTYGYNSSLTSLGCVTRRNMAVGVSAGCMSCDAVNTGGGYLLFVHTDGDLLAGSASPTSKGIVSVFDAGTLKQLTADPLQDTASSIAVTNAHAIVVGSFVLIFTARATTAIRMERWSVGSLGSPPTKQTNPINAATATSATAAKYAHVAPYDSTNGLLCFQSGATTMEWGYVDNAGTYTQKATWSVTNTVRSCICRVGSGSTNVVVVWADGATFGAGNLSYGVWSSTGSVVTATTALDAGGTVAGYPMVAPVAVGAGYVFAWSQDNGAGMPPLVNATRFNNPGIGPVNFINNMVPASLPFALGNGAYIWMADAVKTGAGGSPLALATYRLFDVHRATGEGPGGIPQVGGAANLKALPGKYMLSFAAQNDNRVSVAAATSQSPMPGCAAAATVLPVLGADSVYSPQLVYVEQGSLSERFQAAQLQAQTLFSGPRVCAYDGARFYASGLFGGPAELYTADAGAVGYSSLGAGTYQYVAVWERVDALGQRTFSAPSNPVSITVAANHRVDLTVTAPPSCGNNGQPTSGTTPFDYSVRFFRTLNGGTIFYAIQVNQNVSAAGLVNALPAQTSRTVQVAFDISSDATIALNEVLYTQGAQGGLSGILQNDEPPSAKFIAAGSDRFILGGLDEPNAVQLSKLVFPGEAIRWSASVAFRQYIDADVTGVAAQDGQWYVFSRNAVFAFGGEGPDDSGQGTFTEPVKLPSAVGCLSGRSICQTPLGIFFQGEAGIYLLPRGGGTPTWIGQRIQDEIASFPIVTATYFDQAAGVAYMAACNTAASAGILLGYDVNQNEWFKDNVQSTVISNIAKFNGQLLLNGNITQVTGAWKDNFTGSQDIVVAPVVTTGDIRPFGVLGAGRTRKAVILGELRSASNSTMLVEVSTDSGTTYTTIGTFTMAGTAGTAFRRECLLPRPRETAFRFRVTLTPSASTVEAPVVNAITLEVFKSEGTPRLAASERA
jgi:hypothetical protein